MITKSLTKVLSQHQAEKNLKTIIKYFTIGHPLLFHLLQHIDSECPFAKERIVVIDPFGVVWPCCFIQGNQVTRHKPFPYDKYLSYNNIKLQSLQSILDFFHILICLMHGRTALTKYVIPAYIKQISQHNIMNLYTNLKQLKS